MNQQLESRILWGLTAVFCLYIAIRAWLLPMTVDESATAINHVPRLVFDTLTFEGGANPNNHILNTILIKIFTGLFGWHHFVVRLPVLLGGFLYAWAALQLVRVISSDSRIRVFSLLLFFGNPYLLEFFSVARGYGIGAGLMTAAIWQAWQYLVGNASVHFKRAVLFAGFSVYANFTLLIFFAPFMALLLVAAWQANTGFTRFWKHSRPALIAAGVFLLLWITPLKRLGKDSELLNWNALGTFFGSIQRHVRAALHVNEFNGNQFDRPLSWLLFTGSILLICIGIYRLIQNRGQLRNDPRVVLVLLLCGAWLANIAQVYLTRTPYLQARLSLFYWPLYAMTLSAGASWLFERYGMRKTWWYAGPLVALLLFNTGRNVNFYNTLEWFHDSDTFTVLEFVKKTYEAEGRTEPYTFDTEWFMQNSFVYHLDKKFRNYDRYVKLAPYHGRRSPQMDTDFFYAISPEELNILSGSYETVLKIPGSNLTLFRKKK